MFQRTVLPPSSSSTLKMEVAWYSELPVYNYQTTWYNNPANHNFHYKKCLSLLIIHRKSIFRYLSEPVLLVSCFIQRTNLSKKSLNKLDSQQLATTFAV
jgi:hypothetical protein